MMFPASAGYHELLFIVHSYRRNNMEFLFSSVTDAGASLTTLTFAASTGCSLLVGFLIAFFYKLRNEYSASFIVTLVLLPAIVQLVIMLVNGSVGAGIAVAGAFSLVRFRSAPGTGQEITSIFLAMAAGLATGMGYLGVAVSFTLLILLVNFLLLETGFGKNGGAERILKITIPENLDFEGKFDDIFEKYTRRAELEEVKTADMGSVYRLTYKIRLRDDGRLKAMMDEMRQRNGNLEISCMRGITRRDSAAI
jgi:uncharacterized membrane protein YhiD involved in acid resistance